MKKKRYLPFGYQMNEGNIIPDILESSAVQSIFENYRNGASLQMLAKQKQGRLYTERLLSAAMESGFDLKAIPVVMLGGGAAVAKGNVSEQDGLCRVFTLIDDRVNAEGFERILGQFSGGVSKG